MAVTAVQVTQSSSLLLDVSTIVSGQEVTVQNLGPNPIYLQFGAAATVAGGLQVPSGGGSYTFDALEDVYAITTTADQVSPSDTRISVERLR